MFYTTQGKGALYSTPMLILKNSTCLRRVGVDVVEDVDEDEEESDEERHAARYDVGGDEEADPGHHHEQARGQVVGDDVGGEVTLQSLQSWHRLVSQSGYQQ